EQKRRSDNRGLHGPYGAEWLLLTAFPTLKRGAKDRCASGAKEIRIGLIEKSAWLTKWIHAIALRIVCFCRNGGSPLSTIGIRAAFTTCHLSTRSHPATFGIKQYVAVRPFIE
ncbi:MAG TPA: hypothetical protein VGT08_02165, partial [Terracidiphilus sp.]|nr:hypothetical protein [Terracidiphilus sp.]